MVMLDRRAFISLVTTAAAMPPDLWAQTGPARVALYASVGAELTHYDVDVDGLTLTGARHGHAAGECAVRVAARVAPLPLRGDEQQRVRQRAGRHRPPCDRVSHRSGQRRADAARRPDTAADAPDPHDHRYSVGAPPGRVQQPERAAHLPHQHGRHARRRSAAAGAARFRHLRPPGARDAGQPARDPGHPRQRSRRRQGPKIRAR